MIPLATIHTKDSTLLAYPYDVLPELIDTAALASLWEFSATGG